MHLLAAMAARLCGSAGPFGRAERLRCSPGLPGSQRAPGHDCQVSLWPGSGLAVADIYLIAKDLVDHTYGLAFATHISIGNDTDSLALTVGDNAVPASVS